MLLLLFSGLILHPIYAAEKEDSVERRQKSDILSFFLKDPADASVPTSPMAAELFNQAVGYFQKNEYVLARQALRDSLEQDDTNPYAYELLGDIDNLEQRLDEAKANYEIAYNLSATDRIRQKIEKLSKESTVEKKLSTYREEHFIIKYHDKEQSVEGFALRELLRLTYRQISQDFAYYFNHQVVVVLYDEADFREITNAPHWATGIYDGKVRMPINKLGFNDTDLKALTAHEVTHAFVAAMSRKKAPAWINEGLAEYEENKIKNKDRRIFRTARKNGTLFPLLQLTSNQGPLSLSDPAQITLFYEQSYHTVNYLIGRYKMFAVKEILAEYAKGKNSQEVIQSVLKISIERLEREWLASL